MVSSVDEAGQRCAQTPTQKDSCKPPSGAPFLYNQASWDLQQQIPSKEQASAKTIDCFGKPQLLRHFQLGVGYIGSIQEGDNVKNEDEWEKASPDLSHRGRLKGVRWSGRIQVSGTRTYFLSHRARDLQFSGSLPKGCPAF